MDQSSKAKLLLLIMPIDIVEYVFTLFWDNLRRNSCIRESKSEARYTIAKRAHLGHPILYRTGASPRQTVYSVRWHHSSEVKCQSILNYW